jgi:Secretion system C-terminal sorting domain
MQKFVRFFLPIALLGCFSNSSIAQGIFTTTTSGSWSNVATWSLSSGTDADGIPDADDDINITSAHNISLTSNVSCKNITVNNITATINAGGFTVTIGGDANLQKGSYSNGNFIFNGINTVMGNVAGGNNNFASDAIVTIQSNKVEIQRTVFNGIFQATKTGSTTENWGSNTFNNSTTIICSNGTIQCSEAPNADVFNGVLNLRITGTGSLSMSKNYNTVYNNIFVESTSSGKIQFSVSAYTSTLLTGKLLQVGALGFSSGALELFSFTTTTNQALTFTGTATLNIGTSGKPCFFAAVDFNAPRVSSTSSNYSGNAIFTKTGLGNDDCGDNTFNGTFTCNATTPVLGSTVNDGYIRWANVVATDIFKGKITVNAANYGGVYLATKYTQTFDVDVECNSTAITPYGIRIGENQDVASVYTTLLTGRKITTPTFSSGIFSLKRVIQQGATTPHSFTLTGTAELYMGLLSTPAFGNTFESDVTINVIKFAELAHNNFKKNVTAIGGSFQFTGQVHNLDGGTTTITKNGNNTDSWGGNNKYYGVTTITMTPTSGDIRMTDFGGTIDSFMTDVYLINNTTDIVTYKHLYVSNVGQSYIGGNIYLTSTGTSASITFQGAGTEQAANKTILTPTFTNGNLRFINFKQKAGSTALLSTITNSGSSGDSYVDMINCRFFNKLYIISGRYSFESTYFYGDTLYGKKTANWGDVLPGGNKFYGVASFETLANAETRFTANAMMVDSFFRDTYFFTNGTIGGKFDMSYEGSSYFGGDIEVKSIGTGGGITFCNTTGTTTNITTQANGKKIITNTFTYGNIIFKRFKQLGLSLAETSTLTNNSLASFAEIRMEDSEFHNTMNVTAPNVFTNRNLFKNFANLTKTAGNTTNSSVGGNTFEKPLVLTANGTGSIVMASTALTDTYDDLTIRVGGSGVNNRIKIADVGNSTINGNVTLQSNTTGDGVRFGENAGTTTQVNGKTINTIVGQFLSGKIYLKNYNQAGVATASNSILDNSSSTGTIKLETCIFQDNITVGVAGVEALTNNTFNNTTIINKTGLRADATIGGNVFNAILTVNNSGVYSTTTNNASIEFGATGVDTYNGNVNLNLTNDGLIRFSKAFNSNINNNITVSSTGATAIANYTGITIGNTTTTSGITKQIASKNISTGTFSNGILSLYKYYQDYGIQANNINMTNAAELKVGATTNSVGCNIGGVFNATIAGSTSLDSNRFLNTNMVTAGRLLLIRNNIFTGITSLTKNGATLDNAFGGNQFDGTTTITNSSTADLQTSQSAADDFNGDVSFIQSSTGLLRPSFNKNPTYAGSITVNSPSGTAITFGSGGSATTGISILDGANQTFINKLGTDNPIFVRLRMLKTAAGDVTLNTRINISTTLDLQYGLLNTNNTSILNMNAASTTNIGNDNSYINGPMYYERNFSGSITLNLPIGKKPDWRPAEITVAQTANLGLTYKAEVFNASAEALGWTKPLTVSRVSPAHYWDIERLTTATYTAAANTTVSGNQTVKLYYGANDGVVNAVDITTCKNTAAALTTWIDIGGTGTAPSVGSITSTSTPSAFNSFSRFTIGNKIGGTSLLAVDLLQFKAIAQDDKAVLIWSTSKELNSDKFIIERSTDGIHYVIINEMHASGITNQVKTYSAIDYAPKKGIDYYRLKIISTNGFFTYSPVEIVRFGVNDNAISVYPNPATNVLYINAHYVTSSCNIYNSKGHLISTLPISANRIHIKDLPSGLYYIKINTGFKVQSIPFVKL